MTSPHATRFAFGHPLPLRHTCADCGEDLVRCEGDDGAERVFVCVACRTEFVALAPPRRATPTRSRRRRLSRRSR